MPFRKISSVALSLLRSLRSAVASFASAVALCAACLAFVGCERDFSALPAPSDLRFSADTLSFDTIFAGEVTPTGHLTLINQGGEDITIASIGLQGGEGSPFGINVNGVASHLVRDVRLAHGDSLYLFAYVRRPEALPGRAFSQLTDRIVVSSQANRWQAELVATVLNITPVSGTIASDDVWLSDSVPYVVADSLLVGAGARLVIGPGATVLMRKGAKINVSGSLVASGNATAPVSFRHMRQGEFYADIPGQWGGISVAEGGSLRLEHSVVECSADGIVLDSASTLDADALWLRHTSHDAISASSAAISLSNSIISSCGGSALRLKGGKARLAHVTVADYYQWDQRRVPALLFMAPDSVSGLPRAEASLSVANSIIMGNMADEIGLDSLPQAGVSFRSSLLRVGKRKVVEQDTVRFVDCALVSDAYFVDRAAGDFHLTPRSAAVALADSLVAEAYPLDFEGVIRMGADSVQAGALQEVRH